MGNWYVGPGGNDGLAGTSWATRFLTLGKAATSVSAGDNVYVGAGTYRELLTIGVSGTVGNPVSWFGDYSGASTDGIGGVVRITGSNDDKTTTRANCITATSKNYNTFSGFQFDTTSGILFTITDCTNFVINKCLVGHSALQSSFSCSGANQANVILQDCIVLGSRGAQVVTFNHTTDVAAAGHTVQNCIFLYSPSGQHITATRVRGITVNGCTFVGAGIAIQVNVEGSAGALHITANNCVITDCGIAFGGVATGDIVEDYNDLYANATDRSNTSTGAHSLAYPPLFDARWFFQLVFAGAGPNSIKQIASPFDLSAASQLINVAGTSPTATDMRGTGTIGAQREWGALEQDATLKIMGGVNKSRVQTGM